MARIAQEIRSLSIGNTGARSGISGIAAAGYRRVIDAGANRGAFTDAFLRLHAPERMILVEAIPELALKLVREIRRAIRESPSSRRRCRIATARAI